MTDINNRISYMYVEYSTTFHMKFKHLFVDCIYDDARINEAPLVITWAESNMCAEDLNGKYLAIATKTAHYEDNFKVTEELFEDALQAFFIFPDSNGDDDEESSKLRLEFVKALLNK